ncbi:MAG TPA: hypothetical protein VHF25_07700 [Nitriliruptorales bacterium]|nr:hypothetical protein [Nitriliruptorales bacterium]
MASNLVAGDTNDTYDVFVTGPFGPPTTTAFDAFDAEKVEIGLGPSGTDDSFEVKGALTLGASSDGIDPPTEEVTVEVGSFSTMIGGGSFAGDEAGRFVYASPTLEVVLEPLGGGVFEYKLEGAGVGLTGTANPVTIGLAVGDDRGETEAEAEFSWQPPVRVAVPRAGLRRALPQGTDLSPAMHGH